MKISEVLWVAANRKLSSGESTDKRWKYSCDAVSGALDYFSGGSETHLFMRELGCTTSSWTEFDEFPRTADSQQARYNWLMFAHQVALEEGL